jgi:hypothetical protein
MDWITLLAGMDLADRDLPPRAARIQGLARVLAGTQYDHIANDFATEKTDGGQYVPLRNRRPSSRSKLTRGACQRARDQPPRGMWQQGSEEARTAQPQPDQQALNSASSGDKFMPAEGDNPCGPPSRWTTTWLLGRRPSQA